MKGLCAAALLGGLLLWQASPAGAQLAFFGQNKIQYNRFEWQILEGEHVSLYHYKEEEELAHQALAMAESSYVELRGRFRQEPTEKVPLILYNTHHHFGETNLVPYFLPESVGGFTEFLRGRVALPFTGSYAELRGVIRHEMVHVFQRATLQEVYREHIRADFGPPPLWLSEGLAEWWSGNPSGAREIVLRDFTVNVGLPTVTELHNAGVTYAVYVLGISLCQYISETYGDEKLRYLYEFIWRDENFLNVIRLALGVSVEELSDGWQHWLRERYYPMVADHTDPELTAQVVLPARIDGRMPVAAAFPAGEGTLVYYSDRSGYGSIYAMPLGGKPEEARELLRGETEERFESFHPGQSRMDISTGGRLALVAKFGDRDALYVVNLADDKVEGPYRFEPLIRLRSPSWSPQGDRVALAALGWDGRSDLYLFTPSTGALERLTRDRYLDSDPEWSPDGRRIVFATDRGTDGAEGYTHLWSFDLDTYTMQPLTEGRWNDRDARYAPDGRTLLYLSDRDGVPNLRLRAGDRDVALTRHLTGVLEAAWTPDGKDVLYTTYRKGTFGTYRSEVPDSCWAALGAGGETAGELAAAANAEPRDHRPAWQWPAAPGGRLREYHPHYQLDVAQGAFAYDFGGNTGEGLQAVLTDALNDHLLFFSLSHSGETFDNFLSRLSFGFTYVDLTRRLNYSLSAFHYVGDFLDRRGVPFFERQVGARFVGSYPFSRFHRLEMGFSMAWSDKDSFPGGERRKRLIGGSYLGWVVDTARWGNTGPVDGTRFRVALGSTVDLEHAQAENFSLLVDGRRYFYLGRGVSYAARAYFGASQGSDPDLLTLGGSWNLRGVRRNSLVGTRVLLVGNELRFPLFAPFRLLLPPLGFDFPSIEGALYLDAGNTWEERDQVPSLIRSAGGGLRMGLWGLTVLRLDVSWLSQLEPGDDNPEWDFFFGWNY